MTASLIDASVNSGEATGDTYSDIQRVIGSAFDDTLIGDNVANTLNGGGGSDSLSGLGGNDILLIGATPTAIDGGSGTDTLIVSQDADVTIVDGMIQDIERFIVGDGATLDLSAVSDDFGAVIRSDSGVAGGVTIIGTQGNDAFVAGRGADDINGGMGDDRFAVSTDSVTIRGGNGNDTLAIDGNAVLTFTDVNLKFVETALVKNNATVDFSGYSNALSITTGTQAVAITGSAADDRIVGSIGNDVIAGSAGADTLSGRAGADVFAFTSLSDLSADNRRDRITDFDGDTIDLSAIDADPLADSDQTFTFIDDAAFTGASGTDYEVRVELGRNGVSLIQFDLNHDGVSDASFKVNSSDALVVSDFIL